MEFFLSYTGNIKTTGHTDTKFRYRRYFLPQFRKMKEHLEANHFPEHMMFSKHKERRVGDFCFSPLVTYDCKKVIDFEIVLLTHFEPACSSRYPTGDADNLLKTLLDSLRMAQNKNEIRGQKPLEGEEPFYCLMEDDQLVRDIKLRHDKLLFPQKENMKKKDAFILVKAMIHSKYS